ncbi:hypothetical protein [Streptomyces sp. NPDC014894]|uniref:hypothetical protein n=1 Tax=unclassified Streptomyces TaxID=2593676 RepID=UPI0036F60ED5
MRTHRLALRALIVAAAAAGAAIVPAGAAFADSSPSPSKPAVERTAQPEQPQEAGAEKPTRVPLAPGEGPRVLPRGGVAAGDQPVVSPEPSAAGETRVVLGDKPAAAPEPAAPREGGGPVVLPRGGVAAGERPAERTAPSAAIAGSAVAFALVAGAGTFVVRRRASIN